MMHEQVLELIPAYALGALEPAEAPEIEAHIRQCAECQAELRAYRDVVGALSLATPQLEPPAALKKRILDRAISSSSPAAVQKPTLGQTFAAWLNRLSPAWALASLMLVIVLAVSNIWLWQRVTSLEAVNRFHVIPLAGTAYTPGASGVMVVGENGIEGTLVVQDLPVLGEENQYQLWLIQDGVRTSGGVFSVNRFGYADVWILSETPLLNFDAFGVTIEPFGGSPGPTGDKVLGGEL